MTLRTLFLAGSALVASLVTTLAQAPGGGLPSRERPTPPPWATPAPIAQRPAAAPAPAAAPTPVAPVSHSENYRLASHDSVRITVFGEDDLSTSGRIGKDLEITMPLIGLVKIGGQTVREAADTIQGKLRKFLVKPQVAVAILDYSKRRFTILGQVNRPGTIDMPDESSLDLLEAIGMAGGYTRIANPGKITLKRLVDDKETVMKIDGKSMLDKGATERIQVLPGDTILVGERIF